MTKEKFLVACRILKGGEELGKLAKKYNFTEKELDFLFEKATPKKTQKPHKIDYHLHC